ncbi:hypothetical protein GCM10010435_63420 [Winogradskya consettensis]|uniref:DUF6457 domain-containing protein n=1 Tax=Winogradskya consettensis TaxID=113560 RepID=A0A919SL15_9ACTN|nr:DUF6457 domain-containing protein [Actinoplanes consettensis]GIM74071.1 hypothetical protein Aco04nite_38490 [Actinoplanes consettensis]
MNVLEEWIREASAELGLSPADVEHHLVLDVARDVAHNVVRPGAPVTAYLLGLAVGRGADPAAAAARLSALATAWPATQEQQRATPPIQEQQQAAPATHDQQPAAAGDDQ